ncbi:unnamed protein product, partial [Toxocara canis]|uniref:Exostosin domain-containing protein n=1 Tax=Toxocara canis TaxID=6265 RepID=A0A183TXE4_TOXCA
CISIYVICVVCNEERKIGKDCTTQLREQLNRERAANEHLREQMRYLTDLQQRTPAYVPSEGSGSNISLEEMEERKRVFNETIDRVEQLFFGYQKENACQSNEEVGMQCTSGGLKVLPLICLLCLSALWLRSKFFTTRCSNEPVTIRMRSPLSTASSYHANCTVDTCLDLLPCSIDDRRLTIYLEPISRIIDEVGMFIYMGIEVTPQPSREFLEMRSIIEESRFHVSDVNDACLVMPGFDSLNLRHFNDQSADFHKAITAGDRFLGRNLFFFTFVGTDITAGKAIVARAQCYKDSFRRGFDVAIPLWLPTTGFGSNSHEVSGLTKNRFYRLAVVTRFASEVVRTALQEAFSDETDILWLHECRIKKDSICDPSGESYSLHRALKMSDFALIDDRIPSHEVTLMASLQSGTIPVILSDSPILPFSEIIQWQRISLAFFHSRLISLNAILKSITEERKHSMRKQIDFIYSRYFSSLQKIALTTLEILEKRIVPNLMTFSHEWNTPQNRLRSSPLFLPRIAPSEGFTAVILAYNRVESLFALVHLLAKVPSLMSILVVWNNIYWQPPPVSEWPHISRPIKILQMRKNRLSNRFIAFSEITTEAVFSLDDDISTLTVDEIQFAYQTWRENPERLVGFLPRSDVYNDSSKTYTYSSEWSNNMSIVLTGAAFFHKYYGILYHTLLPSAVRSYVQSAKNCEDIAMNFLISSLTGKCPLKVTPRKKFVCPQCVKNGISVWDAPRLLQRSECVSKFSSWMGENSLISTSFRYDPVLYRYPSSEPLHNPFRQVGTL